jgi:hypothetical protein
MKGKTTLGTSQIQWAFEPTRRVAVIGAAVMPEIDGDRQHTMRAVPIGAA